MDPVNTNDVEINATRKEIVKLLKQFPIVKSMHDFRVVGVGEKKNVIFDLVIEHTKVFSAKDEETLRNDFNNTLKQLHPLYNSVITIDRNYTDL